jgi:RND family efflux transporter MFP subunit
MSSEQPIPTPSRRGLRLAGLIGAIVIIAVVVAGVATRGADAHKLRTWADAQAVPTVTVAPPDGGADGVPLQLPGRLQAYSRAPIFARVSGYLKSWNVDIGGRVKAGQLLGEIETPDVDQQLLQAQATLASAKANAALSGTTAKRWQSMLGSDSVSKQETDEKTGDLTAKLALQRAAQADVDRIQALKGFARLIAPFDGVVTARNTDVGALINAGGGTGPELFEVSDIRKLRVYVRVPQSYAPSIAPGTTARLNVPEYPGKSFTARVEASANAVSADSGTTLVQLAVDNTDGKLMSGAFANVTFSLPATAGALSIPASALVFDAKGMRVATIGADNRVAFKRVTVARDQGKTIDIGSGLSKGDRVIESPPDGLADGDQVKIANNDAAAKHEKA